MLLAGAENVGAAAGLTVAEDQTPVEANLHLKHRLPDPPPGLCRQRYLPALMAEGVNKACNQRTKMLVMLVKCGVCADIVRGCTA